MKEHAILRRKCGCGGSCGPCDKEKRELRRSAIDTRRLEEDVPKSVTRVLGSSGAPLDATVRRTLEPRFGHDFSSVRVHTSDEASRSASDVHARAWTVGNDIAFARGHYAPHTSNGLQLLAHELTHVVQQSSMPQSSSLAVGDAHDPAEAEADATAARVMARGPKAMCHGDPPA
jgi:hypothetical protein